MDGDELKRNFRKNLRILRERRGLGSRELSRKIGASECSINRYERHGIIPGFDRLAELCRILKTTPDQLYGYRPLDED